MARSVRVVSVAIVLAVLAAACTSGGGKEKAGKDKSGSGGSQAASSLSEADAVRSAEEWLDDWDALDATTRKALERTRVVQREDVTHVRFAQRYHDIAVRGAEVVVHVGADGSVQGATSSLADVEAPPKTQEKVDEAEAKSIASKTASDPISGDSSAKVVWLQDGNRLRLGWSVNLATESDKGIGDWTIWVDALTGEVADAREHKYSAGTRAGARSASPDGVRMQTSGGPACRIRRAPAACIFAPDPVADPDEIPDLDDTDQFLVAQPLRGLDDPSGRSLVGDFVNLEPPGFRPIRDDDGKWDAGRGTPGFEAAMAYFWIDRTQREIQRLGFRNVRDEPFPVVAVFPQQVDNAFYSPTRQLIVLGVGSKGANLGEDAGIIIHEYGHAVLDEQAPNLGPAAGAYHEAFGDLLAFLVALGIDRGDNACLAPWIFGDCLRRIDTGRVVPDDVSNEPHLDSQIYSSAIFQIFNGLLAEEDLELADCAGSRACNGVRDRVMATLLASNEFLSPTVTMSDIAAAYVRANETAFDGEDEALIVEAFDDHGLGEAGASTVGRDGDTGDASEVAISVDITHPDRTQLNVLLAVVDSDFEPLCETITLFRGANSERGADVSGVGDVSETDCAEQVPPSEDRQWVLLAQDTKRGRVGRIDGFRVIVDGTPFLATGVPERIADGDPDGTAVLLNGGTSEVAAEDEEEIGQGRSGGAGITAFVDITHEHVGDLFARVGVADAGGNVLCSVTILEPDPDEDAPGVEGEVDVSECAELYPPSSSRRWFLEVVDDFADDKGTVDEFRITGPRGTHRSGPARAPIPDEDEDGVVLFVSS